MRIVKCARNFVFFTVQINVIIQRISINDTKESNFDSGIDSRNIEFNFIIVIFVYA